MGIIFIVLIVIVLPCSFSQLVVSEETVTRVVGPGHDISLGCSVEHKNQTVWYGQQSNKLPFVIISVQIYHDRLVPKYYQGKNYGFIPKLENNKSISLTIQNITGSLLGLYYCTSGNGDQTVGSGHVLAVESESYENDAPWCFQQCWVLVAVLSPLCAAVAALLSSLTAWCIYRRKVANKGRNKQQTDKKGHQDNVQMEDDGVIYSAVRFSRGEEEGSGRNTLN